MCDQGNISHIDLKGTNAVRLTYSCQVRRSLSEEILNVTFVSPLSCIMYHVYMYHVSCLHVYMYHVYMYICYDTFISPILKSFGQQDNALCKPRT